LSLVSHIVEAICRSLGTLISDLQTQYAPESLQQIVDSRDAIETDKEVLSYVEPKAEAEPSSDVHDADSTLTFEENVERMKTKLSTIYQCILSALFAIDDVPLNSSFCTLVEYVLFTSIQVLTLLFPALGISELLEAAAFAGFYAASKRIDQQLTSTTQAVISAIQDGTMKIDLSLAASCFLFSRWESQFLRQETVFLEILEAHWTVSIPQGASPELFVSTYGDLFLQLLGFSYLNADVSPEVSAKSFFFPHRCLMRALALHLKFCFPSL
jgi:hypothetical protein